MSLYIATTSAAYWRQALSELRMVDSKITGFQQLAPGVVQFESTLDRAEFLSRLAEQEFIFVRHLQPVDLALPLSAGAEALAELTGALQPLGEALRPGEQVGVQVRRISGEYPFTRSVLKTEVERLFSQRGEASAEAVSAEEGTPTITHPLEERLLGITLADGFAHVGLSSAAESLSRWLGGEIRFRREEEQISRARFKLLEAFSLFPIQYPEGGEALDLGAAPGGWSSLLLERGLRVTAVDTGEMAPVLRNHPGLRVVQRNVQEVTFPGAQFDLITCDMSWNPFRTAELMVKQASAVRSGSHGVLTVKLMLENPTRTIRRVRELLAPAYQVLQVKQLFHNRDEVTMHLVRI